jgi:outer membrane lipoprotein-sorting protein
MVTKMKQVILIILCILLLALIGACSEADTLNKVIDGILQIPNGVYSMSESIEGLVQTTCQIGNDYAGRHP